MRLIFGLLFITICFYSHASLLLGYNNSEMIERVKVAGVHLNDTICDLSNVIMLDEDADIQLSMLSNGQSLVLREKKQRYYLELRGDTLFWTGYENRFLQMIGTGTPIYVPDFSHYSGIDSYYLDGMHSLVYPMSETGSMSSSDTQINVVSGVNKFQNCTLVRTLRSFSMDESLADSALVQESVRIYIPGYKFAAIELRAYRNSGYTTGSLSNLEWNEEYISPFLLSSTTEETHDADDKKLPFSVEVLGHEVKVEIVSPYDDCTIEVSLCSLTGIPYLTKSHTCAEGEAISHSLIVPPDRQGGSLLVVRIDEDTYKRLINFK